MAIMKAGHIARGPLAGAEWIALGLSLLVLVVNLIKALM